MHDETAQGQTLIPFSRVQTGSASFPQFGRLLAVVALGFLTAPPALAQSSNEVSPDLPSASPVAPSAERLILPDTLPEISAPHSWAAYLKGGPVFPLGGGLLNDGLRTGWMIEAGVRANLFDFKNSVAPSRLFADIGGGYAANCLNGAPVVTSGTFHAPGDNHTESGDYFDTSIWGIDRPSLHAALGWDYFPLFLNQSPGRTVHFNWRTGTRLGAAVFRHSQGPRTSLLDVAAVHVAELLPDGTHAHDPATFQIQNDFKSATFFGGVFSTLGVAVTYPDFHIGRWRLGEVSIGAEVEFAYDNLDVSDFNNGTHGLGTVAPLLTLSFGF